MTCRHYSLRRTWLCVLRLGSHAAVGGKIQNSILSSGQAATACFEPAEHDVGCALLTLLAPQLDMPALRLHRCWWWRLPATGVRRFTVVAESGRREEGELLQSLPFAAPLFCSLYVAESAAGCGLGASRHGATSKSAIIFYTLFD
jgi:hypothetical protein